MTITRKSLPKESHQALSIIVGSGGCIVKTLPESYPFERATHFGIIADGQPMYQITMSQWKALLVSGLITCDPDAGRLRVSATPSGVRKVQGAD